MKPDRTPIEVHASVRGTTYLIAVVFGWARAALFMRRCNDLGLTVFSPTPIPAEAFRRF